MGAKLAGLPHLGWLLQKPATIAAVLLAFAGQAVADETSGQDAAYGGLVEVAVGSALDIAAWNDVAVLMDRDEVKVATCVSGGTCAGSEVATFVRFLEQVDGLAPGQQVQAVNEFFNQRPYAADQSLFGVEDLWQSPLSFVSGSGDCEDYAIAKYTALRLLGYPEESLRLIVLMDEARDVPHAVLEVRAYGHRWLLDNLNDRADVAMDVDYRPLYALSGDEHWVFVPADSPEQQYTFGRPASGN
jgi:predicted transglutaminase-like cysteine proteinase